MKTIEQKSLLVVIAWCLTFFLGIVMGFSILAEEAQRITPVIIVVFTTILIGIILLRKLSGFSITVVRKRKETGNISSLEEIDVFYATLFEKFKDNFKDDCEYSGKHVRLFIDNLIKRIV